MPRGEPELWTQAAGLLLLSLAYLLWIAPRDARLTQAVPGTVLLALLAAVAGAYGTVEAWIASRSVAMLVPGD